jgi:hypothetical protein
MRVNLAAKSLDELQLEAKKFNLKGFLSLKFENGALDGSFTKFMDEKTKAEPSSSPWPQRRGFSPIRQFSLTAGISISASARSVSNTPKSLA